MGKKKLNQSKLTAKKKKRQNWTRFPKRLVRIDITHGVRRVEANFLPFFIEMSTKHPIYANWLQAFRRIGQTQNEDTFVQFRADFSSDERRNVSP